MASSLATPRTDSPRTSAVPLGAGLTTEETDLLLALAAPIDQRQREQFLVEVAAGAFEAASTQTGVGPAALACLHRVGRVVQRKYFDPPELPNASPRFRSAG